jgi:two-component system chemotaxis response regulator CheV
MAKSGILLDSGTNEVEILEFSLNDQVFGINVLKIQAIEQYDPARVTRLHLTHPSIVGTLLFRQKCVTLIDLRREMEPLQDRDLDAVGPEQLVLVMEFDGAINAFVVDAVNRIHRVCWDAVNPLHAFLETRNSLFTGSLRIEDREILLVDIERVLTGILPRQSARGQVEQHVVGSGLHDDRSSRTVFLAEDSGVIRERLRTELARANYTDLRTFNNGQECLTEINRLAEQAQREGTDLRGRVDVLVSDIEMPVLDGLALCRAIKSDPNLGALPVIMFSSLINEQIAHKCDEVGADAYVAKPRFADLVELLDRATAGLTPQPA